MNKTLILLIGLLFSINSYSQSADERYDILDEEFFLSGSPERSMYTYYEFNYLYGVKNIRNAGKSDGIQRSDIDFFQIVSAGGIFKLWFGTNDVGSFSILIDSENVKKQNNSYRYDCVISQSVTNRTTGGYKEYRYNAILTSFDKLEMLSRGNTSKDSFIRINSDNLKIIFDFSNIKE